MDTLTDIVRENRSDFCYKVAKLVGGALGAVTKTPGTRALKPAKFPKVPKTNYNKGIHSIDKPHQSYRKTKGVEGTF